MGAEGGHLYHDSRAVMQWQFFYFHVGHGVLGSTSDCTAATDVGEAIAQTQHQHNCD